MSVAALTRDLTRHPHNRRRTASSADEPTPKPAPGGATDVAQRAVDALTKFVPTEMLAPYVTGLSLAVTQKWHGDNIYLAFVAATPIVYVLFAYSTSAIDNKPWPAVSPLVWRAIAATVAFAVWWLSVPTNPFQMMIGGAGVAGFMAIIVSPVLTAVDVIVIKVLSNNTVPATA